MWADKSPMDVYGLALSGLSASSAGLAVQANNVANQLSDGFKAKRVDLVAETDVAAAGHKAGKLAVVGAVGDQAAGLGTSNVDLATEIVAGLGYDLMYRANLKVLNTADELFKATLDLKA